MKRIYIILFLTILITCGYYFQQNADQLINWLHTLGWMAPASFVLIYCSISILFFPTLMLTLAAGALFGPVAGAFLSLLGAILGASISFLISRRFLFNWLNNKDNPRFISLTHGVERHGWQFVALLRLLPVIPFGIVNYGLGLTRINFNHYVIATAIFLIPLEFISTYCGYRGLDFLIHPYTLITANSIIFFTGLIMLSIAVSWLLSRYKRTMRTIEDLT